MTKSTPFFKQFGPLLFGRQPRKHLEQLKGISALEDLYDVFKNLMPDNVLDLAKKGVNSRVRSLPPEVTFWAFVSQALSPGTACREVVRKIGAWQRWQQLRTATEVSAGAYCQARKRLSFDLLLVVRRHLALRMDRNVLKEEDWINGRAVKIVDGTTFSMPDTPENQKQWPQPSSQKPGCGFPMMKLVGLFSMATGALLEEATGNEHVAETQLFRKIWERLEKGDVVLTDRGFCSFVAMAALKERGVDMVARLNQSRKIDSAKSKRLGPGDLLVCWSKPASRAVGWSKEEWDALPKSLSVRLIQIIIEVPGFRTRTVMLATTLVDPKTYPAQELRALYGKRWNVELHFAQIKTIMRLDVLRCQSPDMIRKEVQIHLIAYNLVRALMQRASHSHQVPLKRISFKGSLDTVRHWATVIRASAGKPAKQRILVAKMLEVIANDPLPERLGRSEPRAVKRRPKNFNRITKPRNEMGNMPHRNKTARQSPIPPLT